MASRLLCSAAAAAALLVLWGAPAQAQTVPEGPVEIYLKDHPELPLNADGDSVRLGTDHDLWTLRSVEALVPLGGYQIVHHESGQCLTADTSGGGEAPPAFLVDCADALVWEIVYDDRPSHHDFRFTSGDHFLGLESKSDAVDGTPVCAVKTAGSSEHSQEWMFTSSEAPSSPPPGGTPSSPSPSETPSAPGSSESPSDTAVQPKLPQTGVGTGVAIGTGTVALLGGTVLVLWWQRRRALRAHW